MSNDIQAGSRVGEYVLDTLIGGGGYGAVWQAHSVDGSRTVAVKLLTGSLADNTALRADIEVVAAAAAARSEHVVKVLGGGVEPVPYIVMEYIEGSDLASMLSGQGRLSYRLTIDAGIGIADALRALLDAGIIHRDIKPANVMIDRDGVVKLADFGIAKIVGYETMTMTGQTAMTMAYAAPEVWDDSGRFGPVTNKVDLYALGVVLFQCLAGIPPFVGNFGALYRAHTEQAPNFAALPADAPPSLRLLIRRCLEKRQEDRPRDAAECLAILHRAEAELGDGTPKEPSRFGPWVKDRPHEQQVWAWHCHHTRGQQATVEVHFADSLDYATMLRKAVTANLSLTSFGAERLIETNRLMLHPDEAWWQPQPGRFQFWIAREDLPVTPADLVSETALRRAVIALSDLIDAARRVDVTLDVNSANLTLLTDGSIYLRRTGLSQPVGDLGESVMSFLRVLPLDAYARPLLETAASFEALIALVKSENAGAPDATVFVPPPVPAPAAGEATVVVQRPPTQPRPPVELPAPAEVPPARREPAPIDRQPPPARVEPEPAPPPPRTDAAPARVAAPAASSAPPVPRPPRPAAAAGRKRHWGLFAAGGTGGVAAIAAAVFFLSSGGDGNGNQGLGLQPATATAVAATPAGGGATAPTPVPTIDGLLFVSDRDGFEDVYTMLVDGTNVKRVANGRGPNRLPNASPDGSLIAFVSPRDGESELYVMNADGTNQRMIPTAPGTKLEPNISPDGRRIVFEVLRDGNFEVYTINVDGTNLTNLTNNLQADIDPVWSPDGRRIVFGSDRAGNMDIYVMNADGSNPVRLTNAAPFNGEPGWSPDGRRITFESNRRGNFDIYVMNADGSNLVRITSDPGEEDDPAWSPDGTLIAYTSKAEGRNHEVFVVNPDGTNPRNVSNHTSHDQKPAWIKLKR